mgnify:CR=1 FL=1
METIKPPRNKRAKTGNKTGNKTGEIKNAGVGVGVRYLEILSTGTTAHRLSPEAEVVGLAVVKRGGYERLYICVVSPSSGEEVKREFFAVKGPCPPGTIPDGSVPMGVVRKCEEAVLVFEKRRGAGKTDRGSA